MNQDQGKQVICGLIDVTPESQHRENETTCMRDKAYGLHGHETSLTTLQGKFRGPH